MANTRTLFFQSKYELVMLAGRRRENEDKLNQTRSTQFKDDTYRDFGEGQHIGKILSNILKKTTSHADLQYIQLYHVPDRFGVKHKL